MKPNKGTLAVSIAVIFLGLAAGAFAQLPPAGTDKFQSILEVRVECVTAQQGRMVLDGALTGPTVVQRGAPQNLGGGVSRIETEIIAMDLRGAAPLTGVPGGSVDLMMRESPTLASMGQVMTLPGRGDFPADSFFDVFVEIDVLSAGQVILALMNPTAAHVAATINGFPPFEADYVGNQVVRLVFRSNGQDSGCTLTHVQHVPVQPSHAKIKKELIQIEKKLDLLITKHP